MLRSGVFDPVRGYAHFGQDSRPNQVVKVRPAQIDPFSLVGAPANGSIQLSFSNIAGATFSVLAATNPALPATSWTALGTAVELSPGHFQFTEPAAGNAARFYRVSSQ